jgi:hypothetical protein
MSLQGFVQNSTKLNQASTNSFYIHKSGFYKSASFTTNIDWYSKPSMSLPLVTDKSMYLYKPHSLSSSIMGGTGAVSRAIRRRT